MTAVERQVWATNPEPKDWVRDGDYIYARDAYVEVELTDEERTALDSLGGRGMTDQKVLTLLDQWIAVYEDEERHGADHRQVLGTLHDIRRAATTCPTCGGPKSVKPGTTPCTDEFHPGPRMADQSKLTHKGTYSNPRHYPCSHGLRYDCGVCDVPSGLDAARHLEAPDWYIGGGAPPWNREPWCHAVGVPAWLYVVAIIASFLIFLYAIARLGLWLGL